MKLRKIAYQRNIKIYLSELKTLTNRDVTEDLLLPLESVEAIREKAKTLAQKPARKFVIPFAEKDKARFRAFVQKLKELNPSPIYIWTTLANSCGLFQINSI